MNFQKKLIPNGETLIDPPTRVSTDSLLKLFGVIYKSEYKKSQKACIAIIAEEEFPKHINKIIESTKNKNIRLRREVLSSLVNVSERLIQGALKLYEDDRVSFDKCWKGERAIYKTEKKVTLVDVVAQGKVIHYRYNPNPVNE